MGGCQFFPYECILAHLFSSQVSQSCTAVSSNPSRGVFPWSQSMPTRILQPWLVLTMFSRSPSIKKYYGQLWLYSYSWCAHKCHYMASCPLTRLTRSTGCVSFSHPTVVHLWNLVSHLSSPQARLCNSLPAPTSLKLTSAWRKIVFCSLGLRNVCDSFISCQLSI